MVIPLLKHIRVALNNPFQVFFFKNIPFYLKREREGRGLELNSATELVLFQTTTSLNLFKLASSSVVPAGVNL